MCVFIGARVGVNFGLYVRRGVFAFGFLFVCECAIILSICAVLMLEILRVVGCVYCLIIFYFTGQLL